MPDQSTDNADYSRCILCGAKMDDHRILTQNVKFGLSTASQPIGWLCPDQPKPPVAIVYGGGGGGGGKGPSGAVSGSGGVSWGGGSGHYNPPQQV